MTTPTIIVNHALRLIGATRINDFDTATEKEAVIARDIYDEVRQDLLAATNWNFALRRASLTASSTDPTFNFDYAYPLPADFIRLASVHPHDDDETTVAYRLENQDGDDRVLLSKSNTVYIRYVFDLQDAGLMSAYFRSLFSLRLARDLAAALNKPQSMIDRLDGAYRRKLARAKAQDGVEDDQMKMAEGDWVTARGPDESWAWD